MTTISLDFNTLTAATPYVIGSPPDNLSGYSVVAGANEGKIYSISPKVWSSNGTNAMWRNDTALTSLVIKAMAVLPTPVSSNSAGVAFVNSSANGLMLITGTTANNFRIFAVVGGQLSGSALWTQATAPIAGATIEFRRTFTGGNYEYEVFQNGVKVGATYINNTHNTDMYGSVVSRGGDLTSMAVEYTPAQTITSINGGSPITVGQSSVVITHTGFTGAADTVTTNRTGVTATITAGDANSTTVDISGWTEGGAYPVVDNNVTFTVTRGGESASADQTLTKPANYTKVVFSGAIIDDVNQIGYGLTQAGHVVEGGAFYHRNDQVASLVVNADTSWTSDPAGGTFQAWFIPATGATAGNAYSFDITLLNGEIVEIVGGLTASGLTHSGLTVSGLTNRGLLAGSSENNEPHLLQYTTMLYWNTNMGEYNG